MVDHLSLSEARGRRRYHGANANIVGRVARGELALLRSITSPVAPA
jgi:hypothetical protein